LWDEGHTALASEKSIRENFNDIKRIYIQLINELLCLPYQLNQRPEWDKFPGAVATCAFDTIMSDGKTLQIATWHNLGQTFSKVFGLTFENEKGEHKYAYQSSYAPSFGRLIAAMVSIHSDSHGLMLPPRIAPVQVIMVPILFKDSEKKEILKFTGEIKKELEEMGLRVKVDVSEERPGARFYHWEMKGVPLRIEIGPKDLKGQEVTLVRRDNLKRVHLNLKELSKVRETLQDIEKDMRDRAECRFKERLFQAKNTRELKKYVGRGIIFTGWCGDMKCAEALDRFGTLLNVESRKEAPCVICGKRGREIRMSKAY
jgi:prolyl-tRNA synthetase